MTRPMGFVELNRRFQPLDRDHDSEKAALNSYTLAFFGHEPGLGWNDLLDYRRVVVLGEPGSGKSWEFREQTYKLRDEGKTAFFVPLDRLATLPLDAALGFTDYTYFTRWREGNYQAFFFLDSVDEAKHRRLSDFISALDRFSDEIGLDRMQRVRIFISSRISEWRPQSDASEVEARLPIPPGLKIPKEDSSYSESQPDPKDALLVAYMLPLDQASVRAFAESRGIAAEPFVRALDQHHAWDFARRPTDVMNLLNFWATNNRLGSLTEIMEFDLVCNLKETCEREKQDPLTPEQSREGAEILGAAAVFCRQFGFRVPDDALILDKPAIDTSDCLPEKWRPEQCAALLTRPVFDSASYGRIRFHHRRLAEYLAAKWLAERMRSGCPKPVLEDLLVDRTAGSKPLIRPSMAPLAAWLSCGEEPWNSEVRRWVSSFSPSVYLRFGDPSCLPLEFKKHLLQSLVDCYKDRKRVWIDSEKEALSRLADPGLTDQVSSIILNNAVSVDIRSDMLQMVRHGRLVGCLYAALEVISSLDYPEELKLYAVAAIRDVGEKEHRKKLAEIAAQFEQIGSSLCSFLCEALYPEAIDAKGLAALLRKVKWPSGDKYVLKSSIKSLLQTKLAPEMACELLQELLALFQDAPDDVQSKKTTTISLKYQWIDEPIHIAFLTLLKKETLNPAEIEVGSKALWSLDLLNENDHSRENLKKKLNSATVRHPSTRQNYFWHLVENYRIKKAKDPSFSSTLLGDKVIQLMSEDLEWLLNDLAKRENRNDRELALRFAWELWERAKNKREIRRRISSATIRDPGLRNLYRQLLRSSSFPWARRFWYRNIRYKLAEAWWWERKLRAFKDRLSFIQGQFKLHLHIRKLTSGRAINWLCMLSREAAEKAYHHQWAPRNWDGLRKKRGPFVALAAKKGCKVSWKRYTPTLPHEKPDPSGTDKRVIIGLSGIQASLSDGELDFSKMSEKETRLAVRYAVNELNGFAIWLPDLARHHPNVVRDVLSECIRGEWNFDASRDRPNEVLSDLAWRGEDVAYIVEEEVMNQLLSGDPRNVSILGQAVRFLLGLPQPPLASLSQIVKSRSKNYPFALDSQGFLLWISVWLQVDAFPAIEFLRQILSGNPESSHIMEQVCSALSGHHGSSAPLVKEPDYMFPDHLGAFIRLVFRYVRPAEDLHRYGGYSPTPRDDAQRFRDGLLERLAQSDSLEAGHLLRELLEEPALAIHRDWILRLLDKQTERLADLHPWKPTDIRAFSEKYEIDPKTDRDLFKIICNRLIDLKYDVETAENSLRKELHPDNDEATLRGWLARKLTERSLKRYTVPQEEEIGPRWRPDLRIENPETAPISVEIKWAQKCSINELLERLENQLIGQYLRDHKSRYGIYLLGFIGNKSYWEDPVTGKRLSFEEVHGAIEARAKAIAGEREDVEKIAVIGINFSDPK